MLRNATFSFNWASDKVPAHINVTFLYYWLCKENSLTQTNRAVNEKLASKREKIFLLNLNNYKCSISSAAFFRVLSIIHMEYKYNRATNDIEKQWWQTCFSCHFSLDLGQRTGNNIFNFTLLIGFRRRVSSGLGIHLEEKRKSNNLLSKITILLLFPKYI